MSLVSSKKMLKEAQKGGYAVGHFNTSNLEFTQAIIDAAENLCAPVIVATSKSSISYAGYGPLSGIVKTLAKQAKIPVALHLDHGPDLLHVKECVKHGWTSVMRDASHLPYAQNVRETRKVVKYCKGKRISVEAELGRLEGEEGWVSSKESVFTDPAQAADFVEKTGVDSLAVSVGTSHGAYKFDGKPKLDLDRLEEISQRVSVPLVLHGASSVPQSLVKRANKLGAQIPTDARGVPTRQIQAAIRRGICKVNTDTDLRISFLESVYEYTNKHPADFDPRDILGFVREELQSLVEKRIKSLGSDSRA